MATVIYQEDSSGLDRVNNSTITKQRGNSVDTIIMSVLANNAVSIGDELHYKNKVGTIIFKGLIDQIKNQGDKILTVKDFSLLLQNNLVNQVFLNQAPETIISTIVTGLGLSFSSTISSGVTIARYTAKDARAWDVIVELADLLKADFRVDETKTFILDLIGNTRSSEAITDTNAIITGPWKEDSSELWNDVTVVGDRQFFEAPPITFSGTGAAQEIVLAEKPETVKVENPIGTVLDGQVTGSNSGDYTVDRDNKKILGTFISGASNGLITYNFSIPVKIRRRNAASITAFGTHQKRFEKTDFTSRDEASSFADFIITKKSNPLFSSSWNINDFSKYANFIPNELINVNDSIRSVVDDFVITKVQRVFPGKLTVFVGEDTDLIFNWQKEVQNRVKQLEAKDDNQDIITEDEQIEENLKITLTTQITKLRKIEKGDAWILDDVVNSEIDNIYKLDGGNIIDLI